MHGVGSKLSEQRAVQRGARQARLARVRLFAMLALLLPLFGALEAVAESGIPRVEVRIVQRDVPVEVPVVVERIVERLIFVPIPGLGMQPSTLARWDLSRLPRPGTPLLRAAQAAVRAAGATATSQLGAATIFRPDPANGSQPGVSVIAGGQLPSPASLLGQPVAVAVAGVSTGSPRLSVLVPGGSGSSVGPIVLNPSSSSVIRPVASQASPNASGSLFLTAGAATSPTDPSALTPPGESSAAPILGTPVAQQPGLTLAAANPYLGTPTPTMVTGLVRRQPSRRRSENDNESVLTAMSLSDPSSLSSSGSQPSSPPAVPAPAPAPAPVAPPPPPPPDGSLVAPTKTPVPPPPTATPKPADEPKKPTATPVPPTATPRTQSTPTPKPATATPKPATATPKVVAQPTKTPTPKPATPTPKPKATPTPKPKATATPTPKPKATATPKPKATATPTPKPKAKSEPTKTPTPKPKNK